MTQSSSYSAIKNALEVFNECIKNGNEIKNLCERCTSATVKTHPIFKKLVSKIEEDTKAIENLRSKVLSLKKSIDEKDYQKLKNDLGKDINSLETTSNETISKITHALASSGTRKVKKKFEENDRILSDSDLTTVTDETARNFAKLLIETNQKIVDCLKFAHSLLPKFFKISDSDSKKSKRRKKLFIIGDESNKNVSSKKQYEHLGEVTIKSKALSGSSISKQNPTEFKKNLNGYLIDDSEKTEVLLTLKQADSLNLIEFSQNASSFETTKLSATIEINGEIDDDVEIVEITVAEDPTSSFKNGPEVLAVVENTETGNIDKVPVQIVPISPEKEVHGKILEIQPAEDEQVEDNDIFENVAPTDIVLNSTFLSKITGEAPHFATPLRNRRNKQNDKSMKPNFYTPVRRRDDRLRSAAFMNKLNETLSNRQANQAIDQIVENAAEKVMDAILNESDKLENISEIQYADMSSVYSPNQSRRSHMNRSMQSPQKMSRLEDVSEIQYADISDGFNMANVSLKNPNRTAGSIRSPGRMRRQESNLADVSEIQYADISDGFNMANVSLKSPNRTAGSIRSPGRMRTQESNLEDISEIEYFNLSGGANQSLANQNVSIGAPKSPQHARETSIRQTPVKIYPGPVEGILIDIGQSPVQSEGRTVLFDNSNLMQIDSPRTTTKSQDKSNETIKEMIQTLTDVLDESIQSRFQRRQKVHDRSLPYSRKTNKMLNTSLPTRMPMTSNRIEFPRPVQVVPSRIPEDAPVQMVSRVAERPRAEMSPMRPQETLRINQALETIENPFANNLLQVPTQAASQSFHEYQSSDNNNYDRNLSLPLHLTPQKDHLPPMERSLLSAYQGTQRANQVLKFDDEEDLQNVSDPYSASIEDVMGDSDSSEDLDNVSNPFSDSFYEVLQELDQPRNLPLQQAREFLSKFDDNEDLNAVSFELMDEEY